MATQLQIIFERIWEDGEVLQNEKKVQEKFALGDQVLLTPGNELAIIQQIHKDGTVTVLSATGQTTRKDPTTCKLFLASQFVAIREPVPVATNEGKRLRNSSSNAEKSSETKKRKTTNSVDNFRPTVQPPIAPLIAPLVLPLTRSEDSSPRKLLYRVSHDDLVIKTTPTTLEKLKARIAACHPKLVPESFNFTYLDEDNVKITILNEECLSLFFESGFKDLKVNIIKKDLDS